jgi:hypothetical protein
MSNKRCAAVAELAVNLARISGVTNAWKVADVASKLTSLELSAQRHAERLCNEPVPEDVDSKTRARHAKRAADQLARLDLYSVKVEIGGDPRGCCLRLFHPAIARNGWGDGYAVGA